MQNDYTYVGPYDEMHLEIFVDYGEGTISLDTRYNNSTTISRYEYYGNADRYALLGTIVSNENWNEFVTKVQPVLDRIKAGHDEEYDGSDYRASYTDDANDAKKELDSLIEEFSENSVFSDVTVWDFADWAYENRKEEVADFQKMGAKAYIKTVKEKAEFDNVILVGDIEETMNEWSQELEEAQGLPERI